MRLADLRRVNERAIRDAGPRYMPGQDPDAPNLQIASIAETFDALGITEAFRARVEDLRSRVRTAWGDTPTDFRAATNRLANSPNRLAANLRSLSTASPAATGAAEERSDAPPLQLIAQRNAGLRLWMPPSPPLLQTRRRTETCRATRTGCAAS